MGLTLFAPPALNNGVQFWAPTADGTNRQLMATDSHGQLSFITIGYSDVSGLGSAATHASTDFDAAGAAAAALATALSTPITINSHGVDLGGSLNLTSADVGAIASTAGVLTTNGDGTLNANAEIISVTVSKTLALTDANTLQDCNSASAIVLTIPLHATVALANSVTLAVFQSGIGSVSITAVSGVTLNGVDGGTITVGGQYNSLIVWQKTTNAWLVGPVAGPLVITGASAHCLTVGPSGTTNPTLNVDTSATNCATGVGIVGAAAGGNVLVQVLSSGSNENLSVQAKGTGQILLGGTSTGGVIVGSGAFFGVGNTADQTTNYERGRWYWLSNVLRFGTDKGGTGTIRNYAFDYGNTGTQAINVPTANTAALQLCLGSLTTVVDGQVTIAGGINDTSTTGTGSVLKISPNWNPTSTSTAVHRGVYINPTVNYSNGTPGGGSYEGIRIAIAETALPSGTSYGFVYAAGTTGTTTKASIDNSGNAVFAGNMNAVAGGFSGNATGVTQAANDNSTKLATTAYADRAAIKPRSFGWTIPNPTVGMILDASKFAEIPDASTIIEWIVAVDAGTVTVDLLRHSYSTNWNPNSGTDSIIGAGTKMSISSGTRNHVTSITDWGSVSLSPGDLLMPYITAISGVGKLTVQIVRSS